MTSEQQQTTHQRFIPQIIFLRLNK